LGGLDACGFFLDDRLVATHGLFVDDSFLRDDNRRCLNGLVLDLHLAELGDFSKIFFGLVASALSAFHRPLEGAIAATVGAGVVTSLLPIAAALERTPGFDVLFGLKFRADRLLIRLVGPAGDIFLGDRDSIVTSTARNLSAPASIGDEITIGESATCSPTSTGGRTESAPQRE
jgi:hypothetical protein